MKYVDVALVGNVSSAKLSERQTILLSTLELMD